MFKKERPLGSEPWFNPEGVTAAKREWLEAQQAQQAGGAHLEWPPHIFEHFYVVGLPPDVEITQIAEQLCELERKKRNHEESGIVEEKDQYSAGPEPAFEPRVVYRYPEERGHKPPPLSDAELSALCFPHGVVPEKLRRSPSCSALDEVVLGRHVDSAGQCFVYRLKAADNFPLYGICWYVREMLHRPPSLARSSFKSCRAPFRSCMISAPRCYCLLSHYPFFDLHFRVLRIILDLERLERLLEYDGEKAKMWAACSALTASSTPRVSFTTNGPQAAGFAAPDGHARGSGGAEQHGHAHAAAAAAAAGTAAPDAQQQGSWRSVAEEALQQERRQRYCRECSAIIRDMWPSAPLGGLPSPAPAAACTTLPPPQPGASAAAAPGSGGHMALTISVGGGGGGDGACAASGGEAGAGAGAGVLGAGMCEVCRRPLMSSSDAGAAGGRAECQAGPPGSSGSPIWPPQGRMLLEAIAGAISTPLPRIASGDEGPASPPAARGPAAGAFDAAAAAAGHPSHFDGAAAAADGAEGDRVTWRQMVSALRSAGAHAAQLVERGVSSVEAAAAAVAAQQQQQQRGALDSQPSDEASVVQRMWETFASPTPKAGAGAGAVPPAGRISSRTGGALMSPSPAPTHGEAAAAAAAGGVKQQQPFAEGSATTGAPAGDDEGPPADQQREQPQQRLAPAGAEDTGAVAGSQAESRGSSSAGASTSPGSSSSGAGAGAGAAQDQQRPQPQPQAAAAAPPPGGHHGKVLSRDSFHSIAEDPGDDHHHHQQQQQGNGQQQENGQQPGQGEGQGQQQGNGQQQGQGQPADPHYRHYSQNRLPSVTDDQQEAGSSHERRIVSAFAALAARALPETPTPEPGCTAQQQQQQRQRAPSRTPAPSAGATPREAAAPPAPALAQPPPPLRRPGSPSRVSFGNVPSPVPRAPPSPGRPVRGGLGGAPGGGGGGGDAARRSALLEEVALRRSGDLSVDLKATLAQMVECDSRSVLDAYLEAGVPPMGSTYRLSIGDLYRVEFYRGPPWRRGMPPEAVASWAAPGDKAPAARHGGGDSGGGGGQQQQARADSKWLPGPDADPVAVAEAECAEQLQLWAVAALCRSLSLDNVLTLLNAALVEKQIAVFCPHIGTLCACVLSLVPLLRPFVWQSLLLPVTPSSMRGFLEAPVPFVLGLQYKTPEVTARCGSLVRVNVYKDRIKHKGSIPQLPGAKRLASELAPHHEALAAPAAGAADRPVHIISAEEAAAARRFLQVMLEHLVGLCGDLRLHTIVNVGMSKRTGLLLKDALVESFPQKDRPFMRAFTETQMFAVFSDSVISEYCDEV